MKKISYKELHRLFNYNPATGLLVRAITTGGRAKKDAVVGTLNGHGYLCVMIQEKTYFVHRIIYCMHHGYFPENDIDHINRNRTDNRIENLREVSRQCNLRNSGNSKRNTSGVKGVSWHKKKQKWCPNIRINNKLLYLGAFSDFDSAVAARYIAELEHNWNKCIEDSPAYKHLIKQKLIEPIN